MTPETTPGATALLEAALGYARRGWAVFPCRPGGKEPDGQLAPHGVKDATTDEATIRGWWRRRPAANVAIATGLSGLVVVDCDRKGDVDGVAAFALWAEANGVDLGNVPQVETPSGGVHYYFRAPSGIALRPGVRVLEGVDVRAGESYVVAPPSRYGEP